MLITDLLCAKHWIRSTQNQEADGPRSAQAHSECAYVNQGSFGFK